MEEVECLVDCIVIVDYGCVVVSGIQVELFVLLFVVQILYVEMVGEFDDVWLFGFFGVQCVGQWLEVSVVDVGCDIGLMFVVLVQCGIQVCGLVLVCVMFEDVFF